MTTAPWDRADFVGGEAPGLDWGNAVHHSLRGIYNVLDYGAMGDGVADDTLAIQDAIADWMAVLDIDAGAVLLFPPGKYRHTSTLNIAFTKHITGTAKISGYGALLASEVSSGPALKIERVGARYIRNLTTEGLMLDGTNHTDTASALLELNGGPDNLGAFYRLSLRDIVCEHFAGNGILLDGNVFESTLQDVKSEGNPTNITGYPLKLGATAGGASSIDIYGGTYSFGLRNVFVQSPSGTLKLFGGTYLSAYTEAIRIENALESSLFGVHIEQPWRGGAASPSWTIEQAGVYITGHCFCYNVYGTANDKVRYVIRCYSAQEAVIIGGICSSNFEYYLRAGGAAGSKVLAYGLGSGSAGAVVNGMNTAGTLEVRGCRNTYDISPSYVSVDNGDTNQTLTPGADAEIQRWATDLTANRTVTLSGGFPGATFRVVRTGLGAFTLNVGGLKTIPAATAAFVEVAHDGTAWRLTGYGLL